MNELKVWKCPNGHVVGQVRRSGRGIHQLLLYRQAVSFDDGSPADVDIIAVIEGTVMDIRCGICGEVRTWVPGQEAMGRLIESYAELHKLDAAALRSQFEQACEGE